MAQSMRAKPKGLQPTSSDALAEELLVDRQRQVGEEQGSGRRSAPIDRRQHQWRVGPVRKAHDDRL
eukprot:1459855-Heterocapsa_arctica.AAC.1